MSCRREVSDACGGAADRYPLLRVTMLDGTLLDGNCAYDTQIVASGL